MHMLLDTSRVSIMVVRPESKFTGTIGRPMAIARPVSATINRKKVKCLRSQEARGVASARRDRLE
jgi:hypothetical protein